MKAKKIILSSMLLLLLSGAVTPLGSAFADVQTPASKTVAPATQKVDKVISTKVNKNLFIGYATAAWAKADRYTISAGASYSASASYTYEGLTIGFRITYSNNISTSIPANAKKYSRLAVWSNVTFRKHRVQYFEKGKLTRTEYYVTENHSNTTIGPKYR